MVAELASFGAVGTTAGLIGLLATTVEILNKKYHDFVDGADRLNYCRCRIFVVEQDLINWKNTWHDKNGDQFYDTTYEMFWGTDGFRTVKEMASSIENEASRLTRYLFCETDESPKAPKNQREQWQRFLNSRRSITEDTPQRNSVLRRLCYALFQGSYLKESIDRLREKVDDLDKFSRGRYWELLDVNMDSSSRIDPQELRVTSRFQDYFARAVEKMEICFSDHGSNGLSLVLGKPAPEESLQNLSDGLPLQLEFLAEYGNGCRCIGINIDPDLGNSTSPIFNTVRNVNLEGLGLEMHVKSLLRRTATNNAFRKDNEGNLALVATKLVKSLVILYKAPWTRDLCTCGILIRDTTEGEKDICTFQKTPYRCHDSSIGEQRFLHLASALAELCMAKPVRPVSCTGKKYSFEVMSVLPQPGSAGPRKLYDCIGKKQRSEMNEEALLRQVHLKSGSRAYKCAVELCLDLARSEAPGGSGIRPERIRNSPEHLVKPVEDRWRSLVDEDSWLDLEQKEDYLSSEAILTSSGTL